MFHELKLTSRSLIMGIGNTLKQDDAVGAKIINELNNKVNFKLIDAGVSPENYVGKIKKANPDTIIIIDAIDFKAKPGEVKIIDPKEIANETFSTHGVSIGMFINFIKAEIDSKIVVIGIQPMQIGYGSNMSEPVRLAMKKIVKELVNCA